MTLITGGEGFIGKHVEKRLREKGCKTSTFDLIKGNDIENTSLLEKAAEGEKTIIHLAGMSNWLECEKDPAKAERINTGGTVNVLEAAARNGQNVILLSTTMLYAPMNGETLTENSKTCPTNIYAATKLAAEQACERYSRTKGINCTVLRATSVYGEGMRNGLAIREFAEKTLKKEKITIYGDGEQNRNFLYAGDLSEAIWLAMEKCKGYNVFNIAGKENTTINQLLKTIQEKIGSTEIEYLNRRNGDAVDMRISTAKAKEQIGYTPKTDLETGIEKYLDWLKKERGPRAR